MKMKMITAAALALLMTACTAPDSGLSPEAQALKDSLTQEQQDELAEFAEAFYGITLEQALEAEAEDIKAGRSDGLDDFF